MSPAIQRGPTVVREVGETVGKYSIVRRVGGDFVLVHEDQKSDGNTSSFPMKSIESARAEAVRLTADGSPCLDINPTKRPVRVPPAAESGVRRRS